MARRYRGGTITVEAEVEAWEVIEYLSNDELIEEIKDRKLTIPGITPERSVLAELHDLVSRGDRTEALVLIEREMFPKFGSLTICEKEFAKLKVAQ